MKTITLVVFTSLLFMACTPKAQTAVNSSTKTVAVAENAIERVDATTFKQQINEGNVQLVDIRTPGEFNQSHISGSLNYDYYQRTFMSQMNTLDKSEPVYIYCRSGSRSRSASSKLQKVGFTKIYDLKGGINYWLRDGYKMER